MEWLYLALLAPIVLVPVVLLFGYAGCGTLIDTSILNPEKMSLSFTIDGTSVTLSWGLIPPGATQYKVYRGPEGDDLKEIKVVPAPATTYTDTGLTETNRYFYSVTAYAGNESRKWTKQIIVDVAPLPPTNVAAVANGPNTVKLTWTNNPNTKVDSVVIRRIKVSSSAEEDTEIPRSETSYEDATPTTATDFSYQIAARYNATDGTGISLTSAYVPGTPLRIDGLPPENFTLSFPDTPQVTDRVSANLGGDCIIQRISKDELKAGGDRLRISFRAINGLGFTLVTISQPASSGNAWDSHTDLTVIRADFDLSGVQPTVLTLNYTLDPNRDLLIAFDIKPENEFGNAPIADNVPGCTVYYKQDTRDAAKVGARSPNFQMFNTTLAIIEKIEVA